MLIAAIVFAVTTGHGIAWDIAHGVAFPESPLSNHFDADVYAGKFDEFVKSEKSSFVTNVCAGLQVLAPKESIEPYATLRARELEICSKVPVTEEDRFRARYTLAPPPKSIEFPKEMPQEERELVWLTGTFNTILDETSGVAPEERRAEVDRIFTSIPLMPGSHFRFEAALRAVALLPDDAQSLHTAFSTAPSIGIWSGGNTGGGATAESVRKWLLRLYETKSKTSIDWKRGDRLLLAMTGDLAGARAVAHELAKAGQPRDRIAAAFLDRAAGVEKPYAALMANCPDPDPAYVIAHGRPARRERYCEDAVADLARAIRQELGDRTPDAITEMLTETNRVDVAPFAPFSKVSPTMAATDDGDVFSAALQKARDTIRDLSQTERDAMLGALTADE